MYISSFFFFAEGNLNSNLVEHVEGAFLSFSYCSQMIPFFLFESVQLFPGHFQIEIIITNMINRILRVID